MPLLIFSCRQGRNCGKYCRSIQSAMGIPHISRRRHLLVIHCCYHQNFLLAKGFCHRSMRCRRQSPGRIYGSILRRWKNLRNAACGEPGRPSRTGRLKTSCILRFASEQRFWLDDYALFIALKKEFASVAWTEWPADIKASDSGCHE